MESDPVYQLETLGNIKERSEDISVCINPVGLAI